MRVLGRSEGPPSATLNIRVECPRIIGLRFPMIIMKIARCRWSSKGCPSCAWIPNTRY
jgi:hypothetical protein